MQDLTVLGSEDAFFRTDQIKGAANVRHATVRIRYGRNENRLCFLVIRLAIAVRVNVSTLDRCSEIVYFVGGEHVRQLFLFEYGHVSERHVCRDAVCFRKVVAKYEVPLSTLDAYAWEG